MTLMATEKPKYTICYKCCNGLSTKTILAFRIVLIDACYASQKVMQGIDKQGTRIFLDSVVYVFLN
ncbi:hypothetical protein QUA62_07150 [Microcoleus sp. MON1_C1]